MKLESLKTSKFFAFRGNELLNTINIVGGLLYRTGVPMGSDCWDDSCGRDIQCTDGSSYDLAQMVQGGAGETFYEEVDGEEIPVQLIIIQP